MPRGSRGICSVRSGSWPVDSYRRAAEAEGDYSLPDVKYIGVDVGSKVLGIVALDVGGRLVECREFGLVELKGKALVERVLDAYNVAACICMAMPEAEWAFEDPPMVHGNVRTYRALIQILTAMQMAVAYSGKSFREYKPAAWKKRFCGNGRATKEEVGELARATIPGLDSWDHNVTDAAAIAAVLIAEARAGGCDVLQGIE